MTGIRLWSGERAAALLLSAALHGLVLADWGAGGSGRPVEPPSPIAVELVTVPAPSPVPVVEPAIESDPLPTGESGPAIATLREKPAAAPVRTAKVDPARPRSPTSAAAKARTPDIPAPPVDGLANPEKFGASVRPEPGDREPPEHESPALQALTAGIGRPGVEGLQAPAVPAAYADNERPTYPLLARRKGFEGRVLLRVAVRPDGTAESATVIASSGHDMLDRAAKATIAKWRFRPASIGDRPVAGTIDVPVVFRLSD